MVKNAVGKPGYRSNGLLPYRLRLLLFAGAGPQFNRGVNHDIKDVVIIDQQPGNLALSLRMGDPVI